MVRAKAILSAGLLLVPVSALAESASLAQLRAAAEGTGSSAYASSPEGASAGGQAWAENSRSVPEARPSVAGSYSDGPPAPPSSAAANAASNAPYALPPLPRPNLAAKTPPAQEPDPVPPKIKGWEGFKMGFLGMEALGMRLTSKAGPLALPLLILLQPIIAPIALIAGILGAFGVRL